MSAEISAQTIETLRMLRFQPRTGKTLGRLPGPTAPVKRPTGGRRNPIEGTRLPEDAPNYTYRLGRKKPAK